MRKKYPKEVNEAIELLHYLRENKAIGFFVDKVRLGTWTNKFYRKLEEKNGK